MGNEVGSVHDGLIVLNAGNERDVLGDMDQNSSKITLQILPELSLGLASLSPTSDSQHLTCTYFIFTTLQLLQAHTCR